MALVVQKYGGTSVGTTDRMKNVAKRIIKTYDAGNDLIVVVSAMSGETNKLVALANEMSEIPDGREYDVVVATGEQVTTGLLAMYLKSLGYKAKSYQGWQVPILTDDTATKARIESIDDKNIRADLKAGYDRYRGRFSGHRCHRQHNHPWSRRLRHLGRCTRSCP